MGPGDGVDTHSRIRAEEVSREADAVGHDLLEEPGSDARCLKPALDDAIRAYTKAGFDEVYVSQVGGEAEGFFEFYAGHVLPRLREG